MKIALADPDHDLDQICTLGRASPRRNRGDLRGSRSTRRALRITPMSTSSCKIAPWTGMMWPKHRRHHACDGEADTDIHAFQRNPARAPGNLDCRQNAVELIDEQNDVGGRLAGMRRSAGRGREGPSYPDGRAARQSSRDTVHWSIPSVGTGDASMPWLRFQTGSGIRLRG
jgi:hypothetical protein